MSQQPQPTAGSSLYATAICLFVLIGGTVAALSLPDLQPTVALSEASEVDVQTQLAQMVDNFNKLNDERRFRESELIVAKAEQLAPNDPLVEQLKTASKFIRRLEQTADLRERSEQGVFAALESVDESTIPHDGPAPIAYPDVDEWQTLSKSRKQAPAQVTLLPSGGSLSGSTVVGADGRYARVTPRPQFNAVDAGGTYRTGSGEVAGKLDGQYAHKWSAPSDYSWNATTGQSAHVVSGGLHTLGPGYANDLGRVATGGQRLRLEAVPGAAPMPPVPTPVEATRDRYSRIIENAFKGVVDHPLSTFSIDVDTASYANTRQYLMQSSSLPPADAVRIEEMVNYFDYAYAVPKGDDPFASHIEVAACPWQPKHRLVRVALKGKEIDRKERPKSNLVFLVDVSGSMNNENKLGLVKKGLKLLTKELGKNDQVAMVVYAGAAGLVLDSTVGYEKETINAAIDKLDAGGSTAGGAGIKLAYETAVDNFIRGGVNRVILCTDGDFNVGLSGNAELEKMAEDQAKSGVFLSVMGFGRGNLNDAMMERITNKGNGNYAYIDTTNEAKKVFVEQMSGTLVTIAKDVKIQIEFNPAAVAGYRLIGYENRLLAKEDFNDDTKDAGEIGAGHTVTALYEIVPAGEKIPTPDVDDLKYQKPTSLTKASKSGEMLTLKLRYKQPDGEKSKLLEFPVKDSGKKADAASGDFKFASAVASFSMLLRGSKYAGDADYDSVLKLADAGKGDDAHGYRAEFINMVKQAKKVDKRP